MFIIYVSNLNKLNIAIHSHIIFMVIAYNQDLHFKIHYKKTPKTRLLFISSLQKFTQKMNIKFTIEVCVSKLLKHESKLQHNPMFCFF